MSNDRIDPETVAAFLEGRLPPESRAEVAARIARSPDEFEIFADVAAIRAELSAVAASATSGGARSGAGRFFRMPRSAIWPLAIAATIAAVMLVPRLARNGDASLLLLHGVRLRSAVPAPGPADPFVDAPWYEPPWPVVRGGPVQSDDASLAFRAAVRAIDLRLAAEAADNSALRVSLADLRSILGSTAGAGPVVAHFVAIEQQLEEQSSFESVHRAWVDAVHAARELYARSAMFDLGIWAEQARVATLAGDTTFFAEDGRALAELRAIVSDLEQSGADPPLLAPLQRILATSATANLATIRTDLGSLFRIAG